GGKAVMKESTFDRDADLKLHQAERRAAELLRWARLRKRLAGAIRREIGLARDTGGFSQKAIY
ncbi:MAG: hypothetical protein EBU00_07515, partial [Alphaproteobacteria bacterium]|nr:hypothetical protein [Alphaproteobacteria bacterium]